jgi:hypothetical protein
MECDAPVEVKEGGTIIRPYCQHDNAGVKASMIATVYGESFMQKMFVENPPTE